jgi:hypothetical protein
MGRVQDSGTVVESAADIVVPLRGPRESLGVATHVRSTLLLSSLQSLRSRGLSDRYLACLEPEMHAPLGEVVAGVWLPMAVGLAHYRALDAMALPEDVQAAIGHDVNERVQGSVIGLIARTARGAGATPWTAMAQMPRLWDRMFQGGGGVEGRRLGPKDALVELVGLPLLDVPYLRAAFRGAFLAGLAPFCQRVYVTLSADRRPAGGATFRLSWA